MTSKLFLDFYQRHRWFLAAFVLVALPGFYLDLKPKFEEVFNLLAQEKTLLAQVEEKQRALEQAGPVASKLLALRSGKVKKPFLDQLMQAAELNVCKLGSLQTELKNIEGNAHEEPGQALLNNRLLIKLQLHCDYSSFYRFLETLIQQGLPLRLDQFSLKDGFDAAELVLQFSAFPWAYWMAAGSSPPAVSGRPACCLRDPFREPRFLSVTQNALQAFALEQIRYVGYLAQAGKTGALVLLPDGRVYDIYPGASLGKEQGRVLKIEPGTVTLLAPRQKPLLLRRAGR